MGSCVYTEFVLHTSSPLLSLSTLNLSLNLKIVPSWCSRYNAGLSAELILTVQPRVNSKSVNKGRYGNTDKVKEILDKIAITGTEHLNTHEPWLSSWDFWGNYFRFCYLTGHQSSDTQWDMSSWALRHPSLVQWIKHSSRIGNDSKGLNRFSRYKADQEAPQPTSFSVTFQSQFTSVSCTEVC